MAHKKVSLWTSVTPFSKFLALALFIILPIAAFYFGTYYQKAVTTTDPAALLTDTVSDIIPQNVFPNRLVISRQEVNFANVTPLEKEITDEEAIKKLYTQLSALPHIPQNNHVRHCPMETFAEYDLTFYKDTERIAHARFKPTGCRTVTINYADKREGLNKYGEAFIEHVQQTLELSDEAFVGR